MIYTNSTCLHAYITKSVITLGMVVTCRWSLIVVVVRRSLTVVVVRRSLTVVVVRWSLIMVVVRWRHWWWSGGADDGDKDACWVVNGGVPEVDGGGWRLKVVIIAWW
ncbi:hypothetical protein HanRHA438_Chr03g0130641 [Helianthus annuus]|uniref:Transmembrane protein n=1 Tax=Helianthus annuus TaxID=4232 RepID=A0A251UYT7_HELAN|nr:hypothetical protein HanXRQr2_Chr09g0399451 [Helianthus annuus]KAJ0526859.1 hypothetical protein HanHA300_Chr09g0327851 [Helianthus annuus]KAJ0543255.1 hypothetical protein HanHA89_Chr09g0348771 [Helianthus annuus]KAJ0889282.1 hypothetical protein HanRHA438_Chr09g0411231 [Helianthus annuus]KAJ0894091.1 hypothetical protein HanPSC8_Chr09g0385221 [Helianthus annuus]